jgi:hypothetical protein
MGKMKFFKSNSKMTSLLSRINMFEPDKYLNTITYVNNKKPQALRQTWEETVSQFKHWTRGIIDDVKHLPKKIEKAEIQFPIEIHKPRKFISNFSNDGH